MKKATFQPEIIKKSGAALLLPRIADRDNKATRGRSLLLAGSEKFPGAGILAARGALRGGSGYVTLAQKNINVSSLENPDFILADLAQTSWRDIPSEAVLIGPGFGVNSETARILRELRDANRENVIVDADALTVCAQENLFPLPPTWILTPHAGELGRCLGWTAEKVSSDRLAAVLAGQKKLGGVVLLKGAGTLVADGKKVFKIATGNSALAKAGTGDVLAGLITAFRAQGLDPSSAALLGAYVHGATANLWVARKNDALSMTASDVLEAIPRILYLLRLKS